MKVNNINAFEKLEPKDVLVKRTSKTKLKLVDYSDDEGDEDDPLEIAYQKAEQIKSLI